MGILEWMERGDDRFDSCDRARRRTVVAIGKRRDRAPWREGRPRARRQDAPRTGLWPGRGRGSEDRRRGSAGTGASFPAERRGGGARQRAGHGAAGGDRRRAAGCRRRGGGARRVMRRAAGESGGPQGLVREADGRGGDTPVGGAGGGWPSSGAGVGDEA